MRTNGWLDLTVPDAEGVRDFYRKVAGWAPPPPSLAPTSSAGSDPNPVSSQRRPIPIGRMGPSVSRCVEINVRM